MMAVTWEYGPVTLRTSPRRLVTHRCKQWASTMLTNGVWVHRGKFAEAVGIDLGCGMFSHTAAQRPQAQEPSLSGLCVVGCGPGSRCRAVDVCSASSRCVGVTLNRQGTLGTLKAAHEWVLAAHNRTFLRKRLRRCQELLLTFGSLGDHPFERLDASSRQALHRGVVAAPVLRRVAGSRRAGGDRGALLARSPQNAAKGPLKGPLQQLQHLQQKWRAQLCSEFNRGAFYPSVPRGHVRTDGHTHASFVEPSPGVSTDLVFDVGYHAGRDTALFLRKGMRVRAVEADADTIASTLGRHPAIRAAQRESDATQLNSTMRLQVLNVAISNRSGDAITFYALRSAPQMSSIHSSTCGAKSGGGCIMKTVRTATCADLIRKHGTPILLKIDIEGADRLCLESLKELRATGVPLPTYISIEDNMALDQLVSLGYTGFKLVAGREINECDSDDHDGGHSLVPNSIGGMPWECVDVVTGSSRWSTALVVRSHPQFNHAVIERPNDLYAAIGAHTEV